MLKRPIWLMVGAAIGFVMSMWTTRSMRRTMARYRPHQISLQVGAAAGALVGEVRGALVQGQIAMRQREIELAQSLGNTGSRPAIDARSSTGLTPEPQA